MKLSRDFSKLFLIVSFLASTEVSAWEKILDFNDGVIGQTTYSYNGFDDAAGRTVYSNERQLDGSLSVSMSISAGEEGFGSWGGIIDFPSSLTSGQNLWVQFYMYIPRSFVIDTPTNGSLKFIRIRTVNSSGNNAGYNDFQMMDDDTTSGYVYRFIKESAPRGWIYSGKASERENLLPRDRWFKAEIQFSFGTVPKSEGGKSFVRYWVDDQLVWNGETAQTLVNSTDNATGLYFFTYWNGTAPKDQTLYVDNIIMTSEQPNNRDANGFPFIGQADNITIESPPSAVEDISVE